MNNKGSFLVCKVKDDSKHDISDCPFAVCTDLGTPTTFGNIRYTAVFVDDYDNPTIIRWCNLYADEIEKVIKKLSVDELIIFLNRVRKSEAKYNE